MTNAVRWTGTRRSVQVVGLKHQTLRSRSRLEHNIVEMAQNPLAVRWPHDDPVVRELDQQIALLQERTLTDDDSPDDLVKRRLDYVGIRTIWEVRHKLRNFRQILGRLSVLLSGKAHGGTVRRGISLRLLCLLLVASSDDASEETMLDYLDWLDIGREVEREREAQRIWKACLAALEPTGGAA